MGKKRPSAEVRAQQEVDETMLRLNGWWQSDCGWRHRALSGPWPIADALRLEAQASDEGHRRACIVCRDLVAGRAG